LAAERARVFLQRPGITNIFLSSTEQLPLVPEDISFSSILIVGGEAASTKREAPREKNNREPYQTVSTVYFILGVLRTDLWSQGTEQSEM